jgi:hypothetical protein
MDYSNATERFFNNVYVPHERLGFGTLAFFRTIRFVAILSFIFSIFVVTTGIANYVANPGRHLTFSVFDLFTLANKNQSSSVCI